MPRTSAIKEKEIISGSGHDTYKYECGVWRVDIMDTEDGLMYLISAGTGAEGHLPQVAYADGEVLIHFDPGNTYTAEQVQALIPALSELPDIASSIKARRFSIQRKADLRDKKKAAAASDSGRTASTKEKPAAKTKAAPSASKASGGRGNAKKTQEKK